MNLEELKRNLDILNREARIDELEKLKKEIYQEMLKYEEHGKLNDYKRCEREGIRIAIAHINNQISKLRGE